MSDIAGSRTNGTVDGLLRDAGFDDDALLRDALHDLRGLAAGQPEASAAVAALMVPAPTRHLSAVPAATRQLATVPAASALALQSETSTTPAATSPATDGLAARRRAKRRITLTTLSLAVSLAAGGAVAVASDQGLRDSIGQVNHAVSSFVATVGGGSTPAPVEPPDPQPAPQPAQPVSPATVPAEPAVTEPAPAAPGSTPNGAPQRAPAQEDPVPAVPLPDLPVPQNLTPGLPAAQTRPPNGEGQPPALPLPSPPPVPLPPGVQP